MVNLDAQIRATDMARFTIKVSGELNKGDRCKYIQMRYDSTIALKQPPHQHQPAGAHS